MIQHSASLKKKLEKQSKKKPTTKNATPSPKQKFPSHNFPILLR